MAVPFIDFTKAPVIDPGYASFGASIGNALSNIPKQRREAKTAGLTDALLQAKTDLTEKQAENEGAEKTVPGILGQILGLEKVKEKYGATSDVYKASAAALQRQARATEARALRNEKLAETQNMRVTPEAERQRLFAQGAGLGVPADRFMQEQNKGVTVEDMASKLGVNLKDVASNYPLTTKNIGQEQSRPAYLAEMDIISDAVTKDLEPYAASFKGYSLDQMVDALKGAAPMKQAKFFSGQMLSQDLATLRAKVSNSELGIETIRDFQEGAGQRLNALRAKVTPEVFAEAQKLTDEKLGQAMKAYRTALIESTNYTPNDKSQLLDQASQMATQRMAKIKARKEAENFPKTVPTTYGEIKKSFKSTGEFKDYLQTLPADKQRALYDIVKKKGG